jgi:hypothetical protein
MLGLSSPSSVPPRLKRRAPRRLADGLGHRGHAVGPGDEIVAADAAPAGWAARARSHRLRKDTAHRRIGGCPACREGRDGFIRKDGPLTDEITTPSRVVVDCARWTLQTEAIEYTLEAIPAGDGTWDARGMARTGPAQRNTVCFTAGRLAAPEEALAAFTAVLAQRGDAIGTERTPERVLRLTGRFAASLSLTERLLLDALIPAGEIVSNDQLRRVRVDAGTGEELSDENLIVAIRRLRAKLEAETDERVGITAVQGHGYCLFDEGANDHLVIGTLDFSRKGQVAWVEGRKVKLTVPLTFLLELLVRVHLDEGPHAYAAREDLREILARTTREHGHDGSAKRDWLRNQIDRLRNRIGRLEDTGITIRGDGNGTGFRLEFPSLGL